MALLQHDSIGKQYRIIGSFCPVLAFSVLILVFACRAGGGSASSTSDLPDYTCYRISSISADGWPNAAAWEALPSTGLFVDATNGEAMALDTEARIGWTDEGLYFRWTCEDPDIWTTFTERDQHLWDEEVVEVFFSTSEDPWHYFEIEVSPNNLIVDLDITWPERNGQRRMNGDIDWNSPGSRSHVEVDGTWDDRGETDRSWTAQLFIPFTDIEVNPPIENTEDIVWRLNLYRIDRPASNPIGFSAWSPTLKTPAAYHVPEQFGYMRFSTGEASNEHPSSAR